MKSPGVVTEVLDSGPAPIWKHPGWRERFHWLVQGTTGRGSEAEPFDLGLFGASPAGETIRRWRLLREATGMPSALHSRQVHGSLVGSWDDPMPPGLCIVEGMDAHVTGRPGLLLAVSTADCIPIFILSEEQRVIGLVHAGWRGVAGGAFEAAVALMRNRGIDPAALWVHCGPAICGNCYEVGPEVHAAVDPGSPPPSGPTRIDLRLAVAKRAFGLGMESDRVSISAHCTRCGPGPFFSHRAGHSGRQMGVLGTLE